LNYFLTILITPIAEVTATTIGRPSGIAATAKLEKERKIMLKTNRSDKTVPFHLCTQK